ncbi:NAD(P)-binding domain-containing protein [Domibacillus sp. A3M-37]|uniref:pyrroline-5-carboxylate reductase dimerization domain-containing protein n=1 Tax=Domibacillus sp. A3M-37 TaxID=2962037 RepID=UPI0020B706CF|nr:pyrroline-5-carboxylate reductase dimerization domain-containing protein [Domibacillus sp. A3M-37]MCP3764298.1 NAD(P)-binding domain-containing protein [Domibacillus sp. A3M-37]
MKIGIIGTGSIGTVLAEALLSTSAVAPENIFLYNRTIEKAQQLKTDFPGAHVCRTTEEVVKKARLIFVCLRQPDLKPLLQSIAPFLTAEHCVLSTASAVSIKQMESVIPCPCGKVIPSVTNTAAAGGILYSFGQSCGPDWRKKVIGLLEQIAGVALEADDNVVRAASDLTGCGPAFFSKMAVMYANEAATYGLTKSQAETLAFHMMIGLGELLKQKDWTLEMLPERTAAKGGVTGRGLTVIESEAGELFAALCRMTQQKAAEDRKEASAAFGIIN